MCYLWSEIWGRKIIWGLIFLVCHSSNHFLCTKFFSNWTADYFGFLKKLVRFFGGLRKLLGISTPVPNIKESSMLNQYVELAPVLRCEYIGSLNNALYSILCSYSNRQWPAVVY